MQLAPLAISTAASGIFGKAFGGPSATTQKAIDTLGQGMQAGYNTSNTLSNLAGRAYNPVMDYWSRILSGNRGAAMSALAPEIARMGSQNTAEMKAASELMPRTGGRATMMQQMPFQNMQNVQSMFQSLRPTAAGQLGTLGGTLQANATNALNASTNAGRSIMDEELARQKASREAGGAFGGGLFDVLSGMKVFGGKGNA
jgi:hypothetical protein